MGKNDKQTEVKEEIRSEKVKGCDEKSVKDDGCSSPVAEEAADAAGAVKEETSGKAADAESNAADAQSEAMEKMAGELAECKDKYVRLVAEFDNFRRRTSKERLELVQTAGESVINGLLPVLDDCERALKVLSESSDSQAAIEGTNLIYNKLMGYLKSKGLEIIEAAGKDLDTDFHEAVAQFPVQENEKKGKVIDVVQQGYTLHGKVIRFAKVVVGA